MRKRNAFTLVEALTVVMMISILVAIIVPTLGRAREIGRRTNCGVNLKGVGQAAHMAAQTMGGKLPFVQEPNADNSTVGLASANVAGVSNGMTRAWFQLAHDGYVQPLMFGCPSNKDQMPLNYGAGTQYDFSTSNNMQPLSYAFQVMKMNTTDNNKGVKMSLLDAPAVVIGADQNGAMRWKTMDTTNAVVEVDGGQSINSNSANHKREGQNVLTMGNSVSWATDPNCGMNGDNIWCPQDPGTAVTTGSPVRNPDGTLTDSYLMP